ncbi:hypothetical protein [Rhodobacter sp. NSM]|uniref:hypothetical protein n=1 Tax=Rhodobacter sp. NSM TaxID=3457501 RepID=UPI003FD4FC5D
MDNLHLCIDMSVGHHAEMRDPDRGTEGRMREAARLELRPSERVGEDSPATLPGFVRKHVPYGLGGAVPAWLEGHGRLAVARARSVLLHRGQFPDLRRDPLSFAQYVLHRMRVPSAVAREWVRDRPAERLRYLALYEPEREALSVLAATGLLKKADADLVAALERGFRDEVLVVLGKIVSRYHEQRDTREPPPVRQAG